jgi:hypothetical protein
MRRLLASGILRPIDGIALFAPAIALGADFRP